MFENLVKIGRYNSCLLFIHNVHSFKQIFHCLYLLWRQWIDLETKSGNNERLSKHWMKWTTKVLTGYSTNDYLSWYWNINLALYFIYYFYARLKCQYLQAEFWKRYIIVTKPDLFSPWFYICLQASTWIELLWFKGKNKWVVSISLLFQLLTMTFW